jgi:hypothetical protein
MSNPEIPLVLRDAIEYMLHGAASEAGNSDVDPLEPLHPMSIHRDV